MQKQVDKSYYAKGKYSTLERFSSYFSQVDTLRGYGGKKILFIGVGDGTVPYYLRNVLGFDITTYDFDPDLSPDVVGDVRTLPFKDAEFDIIAAFEVLEHVPFDNVPKALREIARVAKDGAVVSVPYRHSGFEFIFKFPFIRTLTERNFGRLSLNFPIKFPGFEISGQHYWEIDRSEYRLERIRKVFRKEFRISRETSPILHQYQRFFILKNK